MKMCHGLFFQQQSIAFSLVELKEKNRWFDTHIISFHRTIPEALIISRFILLLLSACYSAPWKGVICNPYISKVFTFGKKKNNHDAEVLKTHWFPRENNDNTINNFHLLIFEILISVVIPNIKNQGHQFLQNTTKMWFQLMNFDPCL